MRFDVYAGMSGPFLLSGVRDTGLLDPGKERKKTLLRDKCRVCNIFFWRATRSKWISYLGRFRVTDTISLEAMTAFYGPYVEGAN